MSRITTKSLSFLLFLSCLLSLSLTGCFQENDSIQLKNLRCEYLPSPVGIETMSPQLSWQMTSDKNGQKQTAYQIMVASSSDLLKKDNPDMWDSKIIQDSINLNVIYEGITLQTKNTYWWKVRVLDNNGISSKWSAPARFEMGLLSESDWQDAKWIALDGDPRKSPLKEREIQTGPMKTPVKRASHPSPLFRKEFKVKKDLEKARLYICGIGYNEVYINGGKADDAVLNPGQTSFDKRAFYLIHDIGNVLNENKSNAIGIMMGNGFHGQNIGFNALFLDYGKAAMKCMLQLNYKDGSTEYITSDKSWKSTTGPIVFDNVYAGETYDANLEIPGWANTGLDESIWENATEVKPASAKLTAQLIPPIRKIKYIKPVDMWKTSSGKVIYDLGQNIAGWAKIKLNEKAGQQITLRFSEELIKDNTELDLSTIGTHATGVDQRDIYICNGTGNEEWEPRFTYHGFRFIEAEGISSPDLNSLEGCLVRTDLERTGNFECSDTLLNKIYTTSMWTIEDNIHSVPEDCPHREKCAWLGDAHASVEILNYSFNMAQFWTKFMNDVETTMGKGGRTYEGLLATAGIPCNIAVGLRLCQEARPDWGSAIILVPWSVYQFYGDNRILEKNYPHMQRWMEYLKAYLKDNILYQGYGDWCHPGWGGRTTIPTAVELSSTAYYYHTLVLMNKISLLLNKSENAQEYNDEASIIKNAFNEKFLDKTSFSYGTQTGTAMALDFDLCPDGMTDNVAKALAETDVNKNFNGHFSTGIHGAKRLYSNLTKYGYTDLVMKMMHQQDFPSYKYLFDHGFTTWPEAFHDYEKDPEIFYKGSHNHPMQSGFANWFYESVGGIKAIEDYPAFSFFEIRPYGFNQLEYANTSYESVYGTIESNWKTDGTNFEIEVKIPVNSKAMVYLPTGDSNDIQIEQLQEGNEKNYSIQKSSEGRTSVLLQSGSYHLTSTL